jgi:rhamnulokinase
MEDVMAQLGADTLYAKTGLQFLPFNTVYQLIALQRRGSPLLAQAKALLMIPDLLRYFLTGEMHGEYSNATTTQLLNATTGRWDEELLQALGLPAGILQQPLPSGTKAGQLTAAVCEELGVPPLPVVAVGEHDTASAVAAVPASQPEFAYLISGTWSLLGTELPAPLLSEEARAANFTNEGGVYGTTRFLKNIMGLWLIQECRREWDLEGRALSFARIVELAEAAEPLRSFVDPDDAAFLNPAHMPHEIQRYCRDSGQPVPQTEGEIARCIFESLAFKYRYVLELTERLTGRTFAGLHMVGGGIQNELLCRMTASACGREVWAGPVEASALGNVIVQYIALGHIADLKQGRDIIRRSFPLKTYLPEDGAVWGMAYGRFLQAVSLQK